MNTCLLDFVLVRGSLRRLAQLLALCAVLVAPLAACSNTKTIQWREQVKLHNGQVIVVDRAQVYHKVWGDFQSGWFLDKASIRATFPTSPPTTVAWEGPLEPLAIDMTRDGAIYLVSIALNLQASKKYSPGDGFHVAFKYLGNNRWQRIPRKSVPKSIKVNLLVSVDLAQKYSGHTISLPLKQRLDSDPRIGPMFRGWDKKSYF